jgi:hypothetical protein
MSKVQVLFSCDPQTVVAGGNSGWLNVDRIEAALTQIMVDINVTSVRGTTPSMAFFLDRLGADANGYPMFSPTALTAAGVISGNIGPGLATNVCFTDKARLRWTVGGTVITTTVGTGANSATQNLTSTAGMQVGDTLYFVTAAVSRTIVTVTDSTHVVVSSAVNSTTGETVNVTNTPAMTFSASVAGR